MEMIAIQARPIVSDEYIALQAIDAANAELRARNEVRLAEAKAAMGRKYLLHPDNAPKKHAHHGVLDKKDSTHAVHTEE